LLFGACILCRGISEDRRRWGGRSRQYFVTLPAEYSDLLPDDDPAPLYLRGGNFAIGAALDAFLAGNGRSTFLLQGSPGTGKSVGVLLWLISGMANNRFESAAWVSLGSVENGFHEIFFLRKHPTDTTKLRTPRSSL
jgi:hypothetical protein